MERATGTTNVLSATSATVLWSTPNTMTSRDVSTVQTVSYPNIFQHASIVKLKSREMVRSYSESQKMYFNMPSRTLLGHPIDNLLFEGGGGVKMHSDSGQTLTWHQDCLQCSVCQVTLSLQNVVFKEKLFCKSCYIEANLNKCGKCSKVITGQGYSFRGNFWHDTCFGCDHCDNVFLDGKFRILREEKLCDNCFKIETQNMN